MNAFYTFLLNRISKSKSLLWLLLALMTILTVAGPALAEGATGSLV
jgi:type IV secretory pathway component VirB8